VHKLVRGYDEIINNQTYLGDLRSPSAVGQRMIAAGMRSCAIAVHLSPRGFALPLLVSLPFVFPIPPASWFTMGPCV